MALLHRFDFSYMLGFYNKLLLKGGNFFDGKENKTNKEEIKKKRSEEKAIARRQASFQKRLQIKDIVNRCYLTKKGEYLTVFSMGQKAIDLMSEDELAVYASQLETTFSTLDIEIMEFMLLPVPFDLQPYRNAQLMASNRLRKREGELREDISLERDPDIRHEHIEELDQTLLLQRYIDNQSYFVSSKLQSGRVANKHCYVVCGIKDRWNEIAAQESARRIETALRSLSDDAHRCSQTEMEKILVSIFNPLRPEIYVNC